MNLPFDLYLLLFQISERISRFPYLKLVVVLFFIFIFISLILLVRKHIFHISMRGAVFGFFLGIILMIFLDLVFIFSMVDKEKISKIFSLKDGREAFKEVLSSGIVNLNRVLGVSTMVSLQKPKTAREIVSEILLLPEEEMQKVKILICPK